MGERADATAANGIEFASLATDSLLSDSNLIAVVLDRDMIVRWISPAAQAYGLAPVGKSVVELVHADDLDRIITTFDMTGGPDGYESSLLTNVVIPFRVVTPTRLVPFEASGRWVQTHQGWFFVVLLFDVTTRFATTEALRALAGAAEDDAAVKLLVDACDSFDGIDGAQMSWTTITGEARTVGHLGSDDEVVRWLERFTTDLDKHGRPIDVPGADWGRVFPIRSAAGELGSFAVWGSGPLPEQRYLAVVVEPLLDLAALALTRSMTQATLAQRAVTDPVTGLLNRRGFLDEFPVKHNEWVAVMYIDLDHFKQINDNWGHSIGDRVLELVGERLRHVVARRDVVARIGGDEFAVLCRWIRPEAAESIAQRVLDALNVAYDADGVIVPGGASLGLTVGTRSSTGHDLLDRADRALLVAKAMGKATLVVAPDSEVPT